MIVVNGRICVVNKATGGGWGVGAGKVSFVSLISECFIFIVYFSRLHLISSHLSHTQPRGLNPY